MKEKDPYLTAMGVAMVFALISGVLGHFGLYAIAVSTTVVVGLAVIVAEHFDD